MHYYESQTNPSVSAKLVGLCMENPPERPNILLGVRLSPALEGIRDRHPELSHLIPRDPDVDVTVR
jgi:hypothetical protein